MPVSRLPTMLESLVNSILEESYLSSFKVAGNQECTTLVLRFDGMARADMSVSTSHHSTPASFRRKPPSQVRWDKLRQQQHQARATTETTTSTKREFAENKENTSFDIRQKNNNETRSTQIHDSAMYSSSVSTIASPIHNTAIVENTISESNHLRDTTTEMEHRKKNTDSDQHISDTSTTTDSETEDDEENTSEGDENSATKNHQAGRPSSNHSSLADTESDMTKQLDCDKTRAQIFKIKKETWSFIIQTERNNDILKIVLDRYKSTHSILAETDDLIIEYCVSSQRIKNIIVKNNEDDSPYAKMRQRRMQNWQDQTIFIFEDCGYGKHIKNIQILLPHLKHLIVKVMKL